jgi:hypothetical protein
MIALPGVVEQARPVFDLRDHPGDAELPPGTDYRVYLPSMRGLCFL